jgi:hypothetical protein
LALGVAEATTRSAVVAAFVMTRSAAAVAFLCVTVKMPASCDTNAFCCSRTLRANAETGRRAERRDRGDELTDGAESGDLRRLNLLEGVQTLLLELAEGFEIRCHVLTIPSTC